MHEFNQSLEYDKRMHSADIHGSIGYSKALKLVGILTGEEQARIAEGLKQVESEWANGAVSGISPVRTFSQGLIWIFGHSLLSKMTMRISTKGAHPRYSRASRPREGHSITRLHPFTGTRHVVTYPYS
jgi:hypothetical protein